MKEIITTRKVRITVVGDDETRKKQYRWIKDEQYNQYRALNMGMTYLVIDKALWMNESGNEQRIDKEIKEGYKTIEKEKGNITKYEQKISGKVKLNEKKIQGIKERIALSREKIQHATEELEMAKQKLAMANKYRSDIEVQFKKLYVKDLYNVLDKIPFQYKDNKSLVTQRIKKDLQSDVKQGLLRGERSIRNYKRTFPLMVRGRDLKFYYGNDDDIYIDWIRGIRFKCVLGKAYKENSQELRHTLNTVINKEYHICDSSFKFDKNNRLILNLTLKFEKDLDYEPIKGRVVGVDLGITIPGYVSLNDNKYIKKGIGSKDDLLKTRVQMQKRERRLKQSLVTAKGGHGRTRKNQALKQLKLKEKNFVRTYNHMVSKRVLNFAVRYRAEQINLEFLHRDTMEDRILRNWSYYQLQDMINKKAERYGIEVAKVDPYHTSQKCSECGHYEEGQRVAQDKFICKNEECENYGKEVNADYNASRNIAMSNKFVDAYEETNFYKKRIQKSNEEEKES